MRVAGGVDSSVVLQDSGTLSLKKAFSFRVRARWARSPQPGSKNISLTPRLVGFEKNKTLA